MKLYSEYARASISMTPNQKLRNLLKTVIRNERITHVLETGTYRGMGSTKLVAESFPVENPPEVFVTIEINWLFWCQAKWNLRMFPFVKPVLGRSVALDQALHFIRTDEALLQHQKFPDIYIDNTVNPVEFYSNKVQGRLGKSSRNAKELFHKFTDRFFVRAAWAGDNLLETHLMRFRETKPLVILDSAGGIGYLEFMTVERILQGAPYFLLLDDIHHVKHFRSYEDIKSNGKYELLEVDEADGWLVAKYVP